MTTITFDIAKLSHVKVAVYDMTGSEVAVIAENMFHRGQYSVNFDASALASGVYLYQLRADDYIDTKKMIVVK